jgi:hypothetical protein
LSPNTSQGTCDAKPAVRGGHISDVLMAT